MRELLEEVERLRGEWRAVHVEIDGSPVPRHLYELSRLVLTDDHFMLHNPLPDAEERIEGVFRVEPGKTPKELDLTLEDGRAVAEVYALEGDTLTVCYPLAGAPRPDALRTAPGSGLALAVYRRVEPRAPEAEP